MVATSNNGNQISYYVDMGINGSGNTSNIFGKSNDAYLYNQGENFFIATSTPAKSLIFLTGGTDSATNEQMRVSGNGNIGIGNPAPSQKLDVTGNIKFSGAIMPNNLPGAAGSFLTSNGAGAAPTWTSGISGTNTGDVTLGTPNGLSLAAQVLSLGLAGTSTTGALSSTDWNTFNNKLTTIDTSNIPNFSVKVRSLQSAGPGIAYDNSTGVISNTGVLSLNGATGNVFFPLGNITETGSSVLTITGGTSAVIGAGAAFQVKQASGTQNGFLSSTDWTTFNNKADAASGWLVTGNAGTNSGINFLGTSDNKSLKFRTNNIQRMKIDSTTGNVAIGQDTFDLANPERLVINAGVTTSVNAFFAKGSINSYFQMNIKNLSNGPNATTDIVATADNGSETSNYVDLGINGSNYTGNAIQTGVANDGYLISAGNDFYLVNSSANKSMLFLTGGTGAANERMRLLSNGNVGIGTATPTTALHVVKNNPGSDILNLQNTSASGYSSADFFSNTGAQSGTFGFANPGTGTLYSGRDYFALYGNDFLVTADANNAALFIKGSNSNVGINTTTPSEKLDVTGNIKFSGALMPNNIPGASGTFLTSNGAGVSPTWAAFDTTSIPFFSQKVRSLFSATAPITYSNGLIGITQATTSANGYLSSTDWNTFNNKAGAYTSGNLSETGSSVLTITGGTNAVLGTGATLQVKQASSAQSGFLSSTDWTTFNSKLTTIDTTNISNFYLKVRGEHTAGLGISYNNNTGVIGNSGVLSVNNNTGALTMDTGYISNFYSKTRSLFSATAPITYSNGLIGITQATTSANGYLSSTDWNTFNNKAGAYTSGNLSETGSSVLTITGGTNAVLGTGATLQVKQASSAQSGFLSSTDWTTFNSKLTTIDTTNISNFYLKVRGEHTAGLGISYNNNTGVIGNSGVLSVNNNTGALTMDTGYISNFYSKTRSLFSATAPITYSNGLIGITQATTSANGYLSSTDWNTFNNKASTANSWSTTGNSGTSAASNFLGTADAQDLVFKANNTERLRIVNGVSAATGTAGDVILGDANSGTIRSNREMVMREDGDTYGPSALRLRNRNGENGAIFETIGASSGAYLVDFLFKTGTAASPISSNIRFETRVGASIKIAGNTTEWQLGQPDIVNGGPTLVIGASGTGSNSALAIGNFGIGNMAPSEKLDVMGNVKFSGALMPNNLAGTAGYFLTSAGAGIAPTWTAITASGLGAITSLNGLTTTAQTFATPGTAGTAPAWSSATSIHTLNIPLASVTGVTAGLISNTDWNTFNNKASTTNSWSTTGNSGTTSATNFIGTTDAKSFKIKTNSIQGFVLDSAQNVGIGTSPIFALSNPEKLLVDAGTGTFNVISGKGNLNSYLQLNIKNSNSGSAASSDVVATNNEGTEANGIDYIDMGINSSTYATGGVLGGANTAYLYSTGNDFVIGNNTASKPLRFFTTNTAAGSVEALRIDSSGKVGIGTTIPTEKLDITGNLKFTGALMPAGSAGTPGFFLQSLGAGTAPQWFDATNLAWQLNGNPLPAIKSIGTTTNLDLPFITNNTEKMRLTATGNLGIGTTAPSQKLDVNGNINAQSTIYVDAGATNTGTSSPALIFGGTVSGEAIASKRTAGTNQYGLDFYTSFSPRMTITNGGNVGIGTTTPPTANALTVTSASNPLYLGGVQAGTNTDSLLTINNGVVKRLSPSALVTSSSNAWALTGNAGTTSATNFVGTTDYKSLKFKTNGTQGLILDSLGSVGVGTSPRFTAGATREKFLIDAGSTTSNTLLGAIGDNNDFLQLNIQNTNNGAAASTDVIASANNGTDNSSYVDMGINSQAYSPKGSLLSGSNTAYLYATGNDFYVGNGAQNKDLIFFTNTGTTGADGTERMRILSGGAVAIGQATANGTNKLTVNGSISASAFNVSSDRRLKTNIKNTSYGLKEVMNLQPVSWDWKNSAMGKGLQLGLIAQDAKKEIPEIVSGNEQTGTLSINYTELVPVLINAIKEQQQQIDALKKDIELLKDKKLVSKQ